MFQNVIQACADLAKHVATADFGHEDDGSKAAVALLAEHGVIDDETASTLADAIGFRNVLAHEYGTVRPEQVYIYVQDELDIYEEFSQQVAAWFEERHRP